MPVPDDASNFDIAMVGAVLFPTQEAPQFVINDTLPRS
jgi:hypothetical protein